MTGSQTTTVVEEAKPESSPRKRVRHRKNQLLMNILKQMEFYFSDANLSKDRFLGDLVKRNPYVPVELFLKFNKIRTLTQDINEIVKAMKNSTLLELSDDRLKVKRKTPILPYDADSRTVYVESIPVTASREWLESIFSNYGPVAYISLPKFKDSRKIKGYAFIEFNKPEDAQKCMNAFSKMGCKLPTCMPPEDLSSIKMFSVGEQVTNVTNDKNHSEGYEPPKKKKKKEKKTPQKSLELKLGCETDNEKIVETPTPTEETKSIVSDTSLNEKNNILDLESKDEATSQDESKDSTVRHKKTRKRTTKERNKAKNKKEVPSNGALWGLQVLSKAEWKALRNKYLNLQRKYMKEMKMNIHNKKHQYSNIPAPAEPSVEVETGLPLVAKEGTKCNEIDRLFEKIPGVFVKEILPEPCLNIKLTKRTIRSNIHALHVDVKEGQTEVIIRFDSPKPAEEYVSNSSNPCRVLRGTEEQEQWERAAGAVTSRRERGRCRVLRAAGHAGCPRPAPAGAPASPQPTHTHIRFDE